ncbi:MAG: NAD(P)(+) transhydrogenase (Re/Si-specific) subunit beta [Calditrichaeota bacterium]|nr:NAD(P)(+) transhydrogenase (Re/Si-specific) subunit beta [Calditrichota bacterium]
MHHLFASGLFAGTGTLASNPPLLDAVIKIVYLLAAILFVYGIKGMTHPRTAVRGNLISGIGMLLAIVVTLLDRQILSFEVIIAGMVVGAGVGATLAAKTPMTGMPQMVALLNGFGGMASLLVAGAALFEALEPQTPPVTMQMAIATVATGLIGAVTFWGSLVAFAKLQGVITEKPVLLPARNQTNAVLTLIAIVLGVLVVMHPEQVRNYWFLVALASVMGITLVIPIGGADMPVVITLLNSYSGIAACATGFVLNNTGLIIAGALVGSSGMILTQVMCKAMNRSMANVVFGGFGAEVTSGPKADEVYATVKSASSEEVAMLLDGARRVIIAPGYGMAVAQAQFAVRDFANLLESRGTRVDFAVHPVAGRMPGHMNVLLAEANIAYDRMIEMDNINPEMPEIDVAIIIGANDTVNPVARSDPHSPIAGMPILDVDRCRNVVVIKRSLSPGFAGIPNPLFAAKNAVMFFSDGKKAVMDLISAVKES